MNIFKNISKKEIELLIGNYSAPYMYGLDNFRPGHSTVFYSGPYWDNHELVNAIHTFLNGQWVVAGEKVDEFEKAFSKKFNTSNSLMVNSGSSANLIMIAALNKYYKWNDDDQIIVSPVGFPTSVSVVHQNNLEPVFVDIEFGTLNFDLDEVEKKITSRTKAILLSPVLGNPPDIDKLCAICRKNDIKLLIDNCDSLGSRWDGKYLSEYGEAFSNSFYPAHHISTGEGGMVCTNDRGLMKLMKSLAWWGRDCFCVGADNLSINGSCGKRFDKWLESYDGVVDHKYVYPNIGYNLKPLDLQGAIGLAQLDKFDLISEKRRVSKKMIEKIFTGIPGVLGVDQLEKADTCWFGTPFVCENKELKNNLVQHLEKHRIQTRNYFTGNILMHPGYKFMDDYTKYPEANKVLDKVFFVGAAPHYGSAVFEYIDCVIKDFKHGRV